LGYDGKLVVSGEFAPKFGLDVMDNKKRSIGKVSRIFGPVKSPYIAVKPKKNQRPSLDIIGKSVYVRENNRIKIR
jgi:rRNA processing protein Gar1